MHVGSSYVHALEGRLRIKIPAVKGNDPTAREVEEQLRHLAGVDYVSANPTTGNVLTYFDSRLMDQGDIIARLRELGYLQQAGEGAMGSTTSSSGLVGKVTSTVASSLMEVALTQLVSALI
jgi:hypothetical protein